MVLIIVMLLMAALVSVTTLTLLSSLTTVTSAGDQRARRVAEYAAESGVAAGVEWMYANCQPGTYFTSYVSANNASPQAPAGLYGNVALPGTTSNPFDSSLGAWYRVYIYNDWADAGYATGTDTNATIILHAEGHGPDNSTTVIEVEENDLPCSMHSGFGSYAQGGGDANNNGGGQSPTPAVNGGAGAPVQTLSVGSL